MASLSPSDVVLFIVFCIFSINFLAKRTKRSPTAIHAPERKDSPKCFRIMSVPSAWNREDLLQSLRQLDEPWGGECRLSLYPSCRSTDQTALLNMERCPAAFQGLKPGCPKPIRVTDKGDKQQFCTLSVDTDFYDLTPLNDPKGDIVAE